MYRFKVGDFRQYDEQGNYIGPNEITEPTYYETLTVEGGFVECKHEVSAEHLRNRGYIEIESIYSLEDDLKEDDLKEDDNKEDLSENSSDGKNAVSSPSMRRKR